MYHFLGITLRISLSPIDWGGYEANFGSRNRRVLGVEMYETEGFARKFMSLNRYKQIRATFHPEDRSAGLNGDKCYQLQHVINTMHQAAMNTKFIGADVAFDEGGIGSRHQLNPVRQYNKDKPQKFRVDFFVMACGRTYFIHHIDVYQGANAMKTGIHRACRAMPTTQKAALNAVLHTNMHNEAHGARQIALDNKEMMDLTHKMPRGTYKILIDKNNSVLCCQWVDSRVVNVVSSILTNEIASVKRQVGSK
jgi:Transposase IS4